MVTADTVKADEQALLGCILDGYPDIPQLARTVTADDFQHPAHAIVWSAMLAIHADGHTPDQQLVVNQVGPKQTQRLLDNGAYVFGLGQHSVPANAPVYARQVRAHSIRRMVASLGAKMQQLPDDPDIDPDELLDNARTWLDDQLGRGRGDLTSIDQAIEQVLQVTEHGEPEAMPTPWEDLNGLIGGWYPGQLTVIGARPGIGKSILLENAATAVARGGPRVLFVSLEMTAKELTQRTVAHTTKIPLSKIRGRIHPQDSDMARITNALSTITSANIEFADRASQTLPDIRSAAWEQKQVARRQGTHLGLVVVDYLQLINTKHPKLSRQQQVGEYSRGLKQLSKELECPVLAASQLNRSGENRPTGQPVLSDLREAGDIEQDSDIVILMHEEVVEDGGQKISSGDVDLIVAKNRHGGTGHRRVQKWGHYSTLTEGAA
jgi:replicative DNA helicase